MSKENIRYAQKVRLSPAQFLTGHKPWATLDYDHIENPDVRGNLEWTVDRAGTGHGIVVWFDADLVEGVGFSNAPGAPETVYGCLFFPGADLCHSSGIKSCAWVLRQD